MSEYLVQLWTRKEIQEFKRENPEIVRKATYTKYHEDGTWEIARYSDMTEKEFQEMLNRP